MDTSGEVFVSYARADLDIRDRMRSWIEAEGWLPVADVQIPHGADWDKWIRSAIGNARCVVFLWTKHSAASDPVRHEYLLAREQSKDISVIVDSISPLDLPMGAASRQVLNLSNSSWPREALSLLRSEIITRCGEPSVHARVAAIRKDIHSVLSDLSSKSATPDKLEWLAALGALTPLALIATIPRLKKELDDARQLQMSVLRGRSVLENALERLRAIEQLSLRREK